MDAVTYIDSLPTARKVRFLTIVNLINQLFPEAEESMNHRMPTYNNGKGWVAVGNQKNYISLYTCSADHIKKFKKAHPVFKTGKTCINFLDGDEIPVDALKSVITSAMKAPKSK